MLQVNRAADPKSEDGIISSGNKTEAAAVSRTTGAAADKFRTPSDNDRESEDIAKIKDIQGISGHLRKSKETSEKSYKIAEF